MKKFLSVILVIIMLSGASVMAFAESSDARLYNIYGNGMLFAQNKQTILSGEAKSGSSISAELFDSSDKLVTNSQTVTDADGKFSVSFTAPEGGYEEYKIILKQNGKQFATLSEVVFGELWLASGQSNMQYPLSQAKGGAEMYENGQPCSEWLRMFYVPPYPGNTTNPEFTYAAPQSEIEGATWIKGNEPEFYLISAVAYFFAAKLMEEIDMPVGILNASLGGSSIASWLSREAIDSDTAVKNDYISKDMYINQSDWNITGQDVYRDMTANYNHKIEPLKHFRPSGMIWYQGETDIILNMSDDMYARSYDLMQRSYSELFGYENSMMPLISTELASYLYSDDGLVLLDRNMVYSKLQKKMPSSRATVAIYDVPLTFLPIVGAIHPEHKQEIGERMAFAANGLVYGKTDSYTSATVKSTAIKDGSVYVTLKNVGSGIVSTGNELYGFAVCGADGVYVEANAEIVSADTVKIWSPYVPSPVSASYAYCISNGRSNLYASSNGEPTLPVCPFVTDKSASTHYWFDRAWTDCSDKFTWHTMTADANNKFYNSWESENAEISFSNGEMTVTANGAFCINPVLSYKDGIRTLPLDDTDDDYSDYGKMSFYVKNNGTKDIELSEIRIQKNLLTWYTVALNDTQNTQAIIPADGEWHCITADLNNLYLFGKNSGIICPSSELDKVQEISFRFSADGECDIAFDNVRFAPSSEKSGIRFDADMSSIDDIFEKIFAVFTCIFEKLLAIF